MGKGVITTTTPHPTTWPIVPTSPLLSVCTGLISPQPLTRLGDGKAGKENWIEERKEKDKKKRLGLGLVVLQAVQHFS